MAKASEPARNSVDPAEAAHFGALAKDWWDPKGSSAMLHRLNPVRLRFLREAVDRHFARDAADMTPLAGRSALDMGCGAGLLAEPLARLGADVTGIDAAPENIGIARAHAAMTGVPVTYREGGVEAVSGQQFDLVASMEVIEHVTDPHDFVAGLAGALAPDGLLILSTPNRTALSRLGMITLGEGTGLIPRGTHDWNRFLTPGELTGLLEDAGLSVADLRGIAFSPARGFVLSDDTMLNYILAAHWR